MAWYSPCHRRDQNITVASNSKGKSRGDNQSTAPAWLVLALYRAQPWLAAQTQAEYKRKAARAETIEALEVNIEWTILELVRRRPKRASLACPLSQTPSRSKAFLLFLCLSLRIDFPCWACQSKIKENEEVRAALQRDGRGVVILVKLGKPSVPMQWSDASLNWAPPPRAVFSISRKWERWLPPPRVRRRSQPRRLPP